MFTEQQIEKILSRLPSRTLEDYRSIAETIDTWNKITARALAPEPLRNEERDLSTTPGVSGPPKNSYLAGRGFNLNTILADIEPDLLLFHPKKLINRHASIMDLGVVFKQSDLWTILFNAPRGFFLQDWSDLIKKLQYIEQNVLDLLYDKRELKSMEVHPIIKNAAVSEVDFDHIRTRYLFASRSGYLALAHMYKVQCAADRPTLHHLILQDNQSFLEKFSPYCSDEEYSAFANLIKNSYMDEDDARVFEQLADLEATTYASS